MDPNTIDRIARLVGAGQSRRRVLKSLASGALGAAAAVIGIEATAAAARCRDQGVVCSKNADCCSATCLPKDRTGRRICAECSSVAQCPPSNDLCHTATCTSNICGFSVNVGVACNDNNACTIGETCQPNGTCGGGTSTVCVALGQCYVSGTCNSSTGVCSNLTKANGTPCVNTDACAPNSTCQTGICTGTGITCTPLDQCHDAGTCNHTSGVCSNPVKPDETPCDDGDAATCNDVCIGGTCAGTVVDLTSDNANCGSCGNQCTGVDETCGGGGTPGVCGSGGFGTPTPTPTPPPGGITASSDEPATPTAGA
jgi:hypothetical protein